MLSIPTWLQGAAETTDKKPPAMDYTDPQAYMDAAMHMVEEHGLNVVKAIAIFVIGRWVVKIAVGIIKKLLAKQNVDAALTGFLANILHLAGLAMVLIAVLGTLNVPTASFVAVLGAAVFAVGFALQGSLSNFAAGVMIIFFKPFKIGDFVEGGGASGVILEITVFSTMLRTGDNKKIIVPNAGMTGGNIVNYSARDTRRVDLVFGISYDDDMTKAKAIMQRVCDSDERILKDPAVTIGLIELADSSVNFVCRPWVKSADYWGVYFDLNENMKRAFDDAGINIPYPQRDVHMHEVKAG